MPALLSLILPVIFPSWRFFKSVEPSPRVQWAANRPDGTQTGWQNFRPRPLRVSPARMLWRLFWNPVWNDGLFVVSCAERISLTPNQQDIDQIARRIRQEALAPPAVPSGTRLHFRIVFVQRGPTGLIKEVLFQSDPFDADRGRGR